MSKKNAPTGLSWGKASDELKAKVKLVLQMTQNNRYSVSRIYAAHNAVFGLTEAPQTCSTCLTSRASALRKWWGEQSPKDTESVPTTGDFHTPPAPDTEGGDEATTYDEVVAKYKIKFDEGGEMETLANFITAGAATEGNGITANELELISARHGELTAEHSTAELEGLVAGKLEALGVTDDSTAEDKLEAYEALSGELDNTEAEQAHYVAQIEILTRSIADTKPKVEAGVTVLDMGEGVLGMHFTPSADDAAKGTILNADGSKVKAGTYNTADGKTIAVQVGGRASIKE